MAEQDTEPVEVMVRQLGKDITINPVLGKRSAYCSSPSFSSQSEICCIGSTAMCG
jgi:hypothetical protein